ISSSDSTPTRYFPFTSIDRLRPSRFTLFPYTTLFRSHIGYLKDKKAEDIQSEAYKISIEKQLRKLAVILGAPLILCDIVLLHIRSEEHTSELQSRFDLVCRLLL